MHSLFSKKMIAIFIGIILTVGCSFAEDSATPLTPEEMNVQEGLSYGQTFGTYDGTLDGRAHQEAGIDIGYYQSMPSETAIIEKYNLSNEDLFYKLNFIKAYQDYYEIAYNSAYRSANLSKKSVPISNGYGNGIKAGTVEGKAAAMRDYYQNRFTNWERALTEFVNERSLNIRYALDGEMTEYGESFRSGFNQAFFEAYTDAFQNTKLDAAIRNRTSELVTTNSSRLEFKDTFVDYNSGEELVSNKTLVRIEIPDAAVYSPTYLSLYKDKNVNSNYIQFETVSPKYVVKVDNVKGGMELNKPLKLVFKFNGSENAGIYKLMNNKWFYQITHFTEEEIYTEIPDGFFTGGEYMVMIDPENSAFTDMRFNWARDEINALKRRGYLEDKDLFRPTNFITRIEMAKMLYNVYSNGEEDTIAWNYSIKDDLINPDDMKYMNYVIGRAYMKLDADGKFNPDETVSYKEVEEIMSSILMDDFKWEDVANKMLRDKYKRSRGSESLSRPIFRDEFAYIMYLYDDLK